MKLLTLNCHSWQEENQEAKIKHLAETIKEKAYDVIALQEVSQSQNGQIVYDNVKEDNYAYVLLMELEKLGVSDYSLVWDLAHYGYEVLEEGVAILTKHPIVGRDSFFVSKAEVPTIWKTRKIVGATIEFQGEPLSFYSCHLGWWGDEEEPAKYQMEQLLSKFDSKKAFFMGDFNNSAHIRGEGYDFLLKNGFIDTYTAAVERDSGVTVEGKIAGWDENKQDLRIDLILTNFEVSVQSSKVIFNGENKEVVSDHYGVEVEVLVIAG
ncbi:endonuclease/exonuclease/phosphatase family protein [Bacillus sp. FJAT-45066]|uniref:endonuclease/exonuclease/phosphatase family protein n=1 Tax=Bacillus sp. FJAT-45066 TaxID=2011010 RepID=UPI000BB800F2|nr:endonuclease/exonuclease/phosphatase family protein [Bacillus sp. FJAT-45066]